MHYLDNAATTPVRPEAAEAAGRVMREEWGNPSSTHRLGRESALRLDAWRKTVADALGCRPSELYFTSCGTESDNWAIRNAVDAGRHHGRHIVTTAIEHPAVLEPLRMLEQRGWEVTRIAPDRDGRITADAVVSAVREDTVLVCVMLVNNELGTVLPVADIAHRIRDSGSQAMIHCDAVQAFLKMPFTPAELGVDTLAVSGHKIGAPKGIGALYCRGGARLLPLLYGGGQERSLRSGTEPTSQIAAFAKAAELGAAEREKNILKVSQLRAYAKQKLKEAVPDLVFLPGEGVPHILAVSLPGFMAEPMVRFLGDRDIFVSSGSACHRGSPSHVFAALQIPKDVRDGVLRISFSPANTQEDVDALADGLAEASRNMFRTMS